MERARPLVQLDRYTGLPGISQVERGTSGINIRDLQNHPGDLETLDAYCGADSVRRAADLLHLHHSRIARSLDQIGRTLGINLTEPTGSIRARLSRTAWRLLDD